MYDNSKLFVPRAELKMTVIDGLVDYVNSDSLAVMQMYDPYVINVSEIYNHHNQVVVFLGPGEYHHDSWLDDIFCRSKNYHKQIRSNTNKFKQLVYTNKRKLWQ